MPVHLIIPSFIAGLLTFLAPCTLPLVPGYVGFIGGVSLKDLSDPIKRRGARRKILVNAVLYVVGFSIVFILLGSLFGLGGSLLVRYRLWLSRIGGIFVIIFGLYMMHLLNIPFFQSETRFHPTRFLRPGQPVSSLIFGMTFAFGWTPCVGPILGSVLTLAASAATVYQGMFLLTVFTAGLAVPFLIVAYAAGSATAYIQRVGKYLNIISIVGGAFLVFLGILLVTDNLPKWVSLFYQTFDFINYDRLLDYL